MAKKPSIKSFSKCFNEMKRLSGDTLSDDKINQLLDEIKIKINEDKFKQGEAKTEKILKEEIFDNFKYQQALDKRNLAENNMKALNEYQKIIDAIELSGGNIDAVDGVKGILVGIQKFSQLARNSIGSKQDTIEIVEIGKLYRLISKISKTSWDDFTSGKMDLEIKQEMLGVNTGLKQAKQLADILKSFQEDLRLRLNDLGANIGKLDDWITRTVHNTDKMANASKRTKVVQDNKVAWREYIRERLDLKRSFSEVADIIKVNQILDDIYDSLMTGDHLKHGGTNSVYGTRNVANRLNASRVLHFKDAVARHEYDIMFGEPSLKESVISVISNSAKNIALMEVLGTNPQATLEKILSLLRKKYKSTNADLTKKLVFKTFKNEFVEIDGSINAIGNETLAKVGMVVRTLQATGKLGFAGISSISDLAQYMGTTNFQGRGFNSLSIRERNLLKLYGIDDGKWDLLRSIKTLDVNNKRYLTAEGVNELSDEAIKKYVGRSLSEREIRNFKKDLEITWRNVLVDQATHGTPEPDAAIRAVMNQGLEKGTGKGETIRFIGQFKSFPITIWKKIIGRELNSYGPDDSKFSKFSGLTSILILGTMFGYISMSAKDMLRGRSPRDPEKLSTILEALSQGGGLGIYGDFIINEVQNEYGNNIWETILGPTASDINKIREIVLNLNDPAKAGKKFLQFAENNVPFLNLYYTKAAYDYLIGYQIKEFLDPGFFERMRIRHEETRGQTYFLKP